MTAAGPTIPEERGLPMKILCFGDSNTYGYDPRSYFGSRYPAQHRWVDLLAEKMDCKAVNAGENGREIPWREWELADFHRMLRKEQPMDLLIVMLGTNDLLRGNSPETVAGRMEAFLEASDPEKGKILLIGPPAMKLGEWVPTHTLTDASTELNHRYKSLSERLGVDFTDAGMWNISLAFDGVHFTEEGHEAFSERLATYLNKGE